MCGIAGYSGEFAPDLLRRMARVMSHRGPDGEGVWHDHTAGIGLAHRRLSIIDLSNAGHQPMLSRDGRTIISYNGEIYNFRKLRDELQGAGVQFKGASDTEVLLNLYLRYGTEMLSRLNGIFAFAIWDADRREMFIARDGLGVKPLYYAKTPRGIIFASEIKALLLEDSLSVEINPAAVARHLTFLWSPAPSTILKSVKKLEPGRAMILQDGQIKRQWSHYRLPNGTGQKFICVDEAREQLRSSLELAVERQMIADVPVGAFLSGGLDSSAVVAFARHHSKERLQCFTIGFDDKQAASSEGMNADLPYARRVAKHLDVDLHTIMVGPEMSDHLQEMIYHLDEPLADPAPLNALFISRLAREHGIKVLLSGAGGDDILTGYRRHYALGLEQYWASLPSVLRGGMAALAARVPPKHAALRRFRKAFEYAGMDGSDRIASYFFWLNPTSACKLLAPEHRHEASLETIVEPLVSALHGLPDKATRLDHMLYLESKFFLADHNLNYTDKMAMAHGVEVRVPLLDPDLVALAARIPDDMKQRGSTGKWIFKKAMEGILPDDIIYRPKTGFGAPLRNWLHGPLKPMVEELLGRNALEQRGIFDADAVALLIQKDSLGQVDAAYTIFSMMCIELWCRTFLDKAICCIGRTR